MNFNRLLILTIFACFIIASCSNENPRLRSVDNERYGGILKINIVEDGPTTFFPQEALVGNAITIVQVGYETLLRFNDEGTTIEGSLAEKWEINEAGDQYTIHLNENVYFHDNECFEDGKGRELTAEDVAYCLTQLCVKNETNRFSHLISEQIVGGTERVENSQFGNGNSYLEGIEIIDDYELKINLTNPSYSFINLLTHYATSIYPREAHIHYGKNMSRHMVGTGPFKLKTDFPGKSVIFVRNDNYWKVDEEGHPLPYIDGLKMTFIDKQNDILEATQNNMLDIIVSPPRDLLSKLPTSDNSSANGSQLDVHQSTSWDINFLSFLMTDSVFQDVRVRKAFNFAIDRKHIIDSVFHGEFEIANYGIIPNNFADCKTTDGYTFNPKKAKELLKEAGFGRAKEFPNITIHITESEVSVELASSIQKMLYANLGVVVDISALDTDSHYNKYDQSILPLAEARWEADYFDPDNFLTLFLSHLTPDKGGLNSGLFNNPSYDSLYSAGMMEFDKGKRIQYYKDANKILYDQAVIIPLYTKMKTYVVSSRIKSLPVINNAEIRLASTYIVN